MSTRKLIECDLCNKQLTTKEVDIRPREYAMIIRFNLGEYQKPTDTIKYRDLCDVCLSELRGAIDKIVRWRKEANAESPQTTP